MDAIELNLDPDSLTIGDLEDFEDFVGKPINEAIRQVPAVDADGNKVFDERGRPEMTVSVSAKALKALIWIVQRKKTPGFSLEDARNVRVSSLALGAPSEDEQGNA